MLIKFEPWKKFAVYIVNPVPKVVYVGSPTIRDRDVSGVGISDSSGLRYRQFGSSEPTVREFDFSRLLINKYEKICVLPKIFCFFVAFWGGGGGGENVPFCVDVIGYQNEHLIELSWVMVREIVRNSILSCSFYNYRKSSISHYFINC